MYFVPSMAVKASQKVGPIEVLRGWSELYDGSQKLMICSFWSGKYVTWSLDAFINNKLLAFEMDTYWVFPPIRRIWGTSPLKALKLAKRLLVNLFGWDLLPKGNYECCFLDAIILILTIVINEECKFNGKRLEIKRDWRTWWCWSRSGDIQADRFARSKSDESRNWWDYWSPNHPVSVRLSKRTLILIEHNLVSLFISLLSSDCQAVIRIRGLLGTYALLFLRGGRDRRHSWFHIVPLTTNPGISLRDTLELSNL